MELGCESWGCPVAYCCWVQTFVGNVSPANQGTLGTGEGAVLLSRG